MGAEVDAIAVQPRRKLLAAAAAPALAGVALHELALAGVVDLPGLLRAGAHDCTSHAPEWPCVRVHASPRLTRRPCSSSSAPTARPHVLWAPIRPAGPMRSCCLWARAARVCSPSFFVVTSSSSVGQRVIAPVRVEYQAPDTSSIPGAGFSGLCLSAAQRAARGNGTARAGSAMRLLGAAS